MLSHKLQLSSSNSFFNFNMIFQVTSSDSMHKMANGFVLSSSIVTRF